MSASGKCVTRASDSPGIVDLSEEAVLARLGVVVRGRDISYTETGSHGKVREHSDGEDQSGQPVV